MKPELPIEMPDGRRILEAANLQEAPCSMLRNDAQCSNAADKGLMYPNSDSTYTTVYVCDMCLDEMG